MWEGVHSQGTFDAAREIPYGPTVSYLSSLSARLYQEVGLSIYVYPAHVLQLLKQALVEVIFLLILVLRSDILQRHISRHKDSANAVERNERACDGCHNSKIRCEGGFPCVSCVKKGFQCKLHREDSDSIKERNGVCHPIVLRAMQPY